MPRQISQLCLEFIKQQEGFRGEPYQDAAGIWTIGYGHTGGITEDTTSITEEEASDLLLDDLSVREGKVESNIHAVLNDNQFGALVSLVYNVGYAPLTLTLGKSLNSGDYQAAADAFLVWDHIHKHNEDGDLIPVVLEGLRKRRIAEKELFLTPTI